MRMLNVLPKVESTKTPLNKLVSNLYWYRVAIMKYSTGGYYTCVIDKEHHQTSVEHNQNFVRWEDAVQAEV
jgi:hypothetical protein